MREIFFKVVTCDIEDGTQDSTTYRLQLPSQLDNANIRSNKQNIVNLLAETGEFIFLDNQNDPIFVDEWGGLNQLISLSQVASTEYATSFIYFPDEIMKTIEKFAKQKENMKAVTKTTQKGENKMMNNNFGKKITGIFGVSMFDGKPSYKLGNKGEDKWVSFDGEKLVDTTEFTMDLDVPSIALPVMVNQVQPNDLIMHEDGYVVVKLVEENTVYALTGSGVELTIKPLSNPLMGGAFVTKVVNPMAGMNMGAQPNTGNPMMGMGMNPMMLMAMSKDGGDDSMFKTMMMMQMMQQNQNPENK